MKNFNNPHLEFSLLFFALMEAANACWRWNKNLEQIPLLLKLIGESWAHEKRGEKRGAKFKLVNHSITDGNVLGCCCERLSQISEWKIPIPGTN